MNYHLLGTNDHWGHKPMERNKQLNGNDFKEHNNQVSQSGEVMFIISWTISQEKCITNSHECSANFFNNNLITYMC